MSCGHTSASVLSLSEKCNLLAHTTRMLHSMLFGRALESAFARALDRSSQHSTVYVASLWHRPSQLGRPTGRADWPGSECKCWCVAAAAAAAACTFSECALVQELPRFGLNMRSIGRCARALMVSHTHTHTHTRARAHLFVHTNAYRLRCKYADHLSDVGLRYKHSWQTSHTHHNSKSNEYMSMMPHSLGIAPYNQHLDNTHRRAMITHRLKCALNNQYKNNPLYVK